MFLDGFIISKILLKITQGTKVAPLLPLKN